MMNETDVGGEGENQRHIFWGMRSKEQGVGKKRVGIEYTLQFKRYVTHRVTNKKKGRIERSLGAIIMLQ